MADDSESGVRPTLIGALIAGGVSVVALSALTAWGVASSNVRVVVAIVLGVVLAQVYERTR